MTKLRSSRFSICFLLFVMVAGDACGGGDPRTPVDPTVPQATLQVTAAPSPVTVTVCPADRCGATSLPQFEVITTLTVRETGGVGGRVDSITVTLRRNSDNTVAMSGTINPASVQVRFAANGTAAVPLAIHASQSDLTVQTTASLVVNATDDNGRAVTATLTVPVGGPPTGAGLFITGNHQIVQAALTNSCGDTGTPATVTGWVTLTGPDTFQLRDTGGTTFNGSVQANGDFAATAIFGPDGSGNTFTQRLEGTFGATGFSARLSVSVQPRNCAFTRTWTATRL
jgi:hypothetical protein